MGYVYLIYDEEQDAYKIGVIRSKDSKRLNALQTGNASGLRIIHIYECEYPFRLETMLHKRYINNCIKNEWFKLTTEEVISFKKTCEELQETINALADNYYFQKKYGKK